MYCQLAYICGCIPARIRHALVDLPETLDETYERTLREINKADWEFAHRLFQLVAVAARPLRVEELAELLAFDFKAGPIPKFHEDWRLEDPMHAVLSTCPSFFTIVDGEIYNPHHEVVQFSHFSVKEFLTSSRLAKANDINLHRYHISETPAHTLAASACLGYLLHLDKDVTSKSLRKLPFTEYSAEYWADHALLEDVSRNVKDGLKELFDASKPHLAVCIWISDPGLPSWKRLHPSERSPRPSQLSGTPLHYAALWGLHSIVELLVDELSMNVNSQDFTDSATPLHLASREGHIKVARRLLERDADVKAQNKAKETQLHVASQCGCLEIACMLIECGADVSAQDYVSQTPLHVASRVGKLEVARMLIECSASVSAQDNNERTPLHLVSFPNTDPGIDNSGCPEVALMLLEHGADVSARDRVSQTPLHLASLAGKLAVARILIECGASVSAQNKDERTPLHMVSFGHLGLDTDNSGYPEVARMLIERGADVSAQDKFSQTPLHLASGTGKLEVARMLIECGASVSAQDRDKQTPLHKALSSNGF